MSTSVSRNQVAHGSYGADETVRYGNLRVPRMPGFGRLSFGGSVWLVLAAVLLMLISLTNIWAAVLWAVFAVAVAAPTAFPTKDGYGRYELLWRRRRFGAARRAQRTTLRQGLTGAVPDGSCRLPGVAAATHLTSEVDMHGRSFGLIHWPHANLYSVVLHASPAGFAGLDKHVRDNFVAYWAAWLGQLNTVEEIVGAAVVVETVPDSGQRLERAMDRGRLDDAAVPELARAVEAEIRSSGRQGSPTLTCRVTVTLSARCPGERDGESEMVRTREEMAEQIGDLLPSWTAALGATGAGTNVGPCTAQEIVDSTRVAFDPSVAADVEEAQLAAAAGESSGTGLTWEEAGPIWAEARPDVYLHEAARSRTWQMKSLPSVFFAETIRRMLEPHKDIARKRVALLYRPETPEASASAADADVRKAIFRATQGRRAKAAAELELEAARQTARQEAEGAPLIRVGLVVTATSFDEESLRRASRSVTSALAGQARIGLRVPRGSQDIAFLTGLPLGLVPQQLSRPPKTPKTPRKVSRPSDGGVESGRRGRGRASKAPESLAYQAEALR